MPYIFKQSTGQIFDPHGTLVAIGYAGGNCGKNPEGVNNPDMQEESCIGPLPQGTYTFGEPKEGTHLGPFAIPLIPEKSNEMHGRSGFFCHGDTPQLNQSASEGCIIASRMVRAEMWANADHTIEVVE